MTEVRQELIDAGLLVPGASVSRVRSGHGVLRLDDMGRAAAKRHMTEGYARGVPNALPPCLYRRPLFGGRPR